MFAFAFFQIVSRKFECFHFHPIHPPAQHRRCGIASPKHEARAQSSVAWRLRRVKEIRGSQTGAISCSYTHICLVSVCTRFVYYNWLLQMHIKKSHLAAKVKTLISHDGKYIYTTRLRETCAVSHWYAKQSFFFIVTYNHIKFTFHKNLQLGYAIQSPQLAQALTVRPLWNVW